MRAVLDESVPRRLSRALRDRGRDVSAFPAAWKGLKNGELLSRVEAAGFDCLLTADKNLRHQQAMNGRRISVIVMPAQRFEDLRSFLDQIDAALGEVSSGDVFTVASPVKRS